MPALGPWCLLVLGGIEVLFRIMAWLSRRRPMLFLCCHRVKFSACWLIELHTANPSLQVRSVGGDTHLGGQDFDWALMKVALRVR